MPEDEKSTVTINGEELPATEENLQKAADLLANEALYDDQKEPEGDPPAEESQDGDAVTLFCLIHGDFKGESCPECEAETPEEEIKVKRSLKELISKGIAIRATGILKDCSIKKEGQTLQVKNMRIEHNPYQLIRSLVQNEEAVHIIIVPVQARLFEKENADESPENELAETDTGADESEAQVDEPAEPEASEE